MAWVTSHWLDIIIGVILLIFLIVGLKMGLIKAVFSLVGLIGGILLGALWANNLQSALIGKWISSVSISYWVSFAIIIILTMIVAAIIAKFVSKATSFGMLGPLNRIGGMAIGILIGAFLCQAALVALSRIQFVENVIPSSTLVAGLLQPVTSWIVRILPDSPSFLASIKQFFAGL